MLLYWTSSSPLWTFSSPPSLSTISLVVHLLFSSCLSPLYLLILPLFPPPPILLLLPPPLLSPMICLSLSLSSKKKHCVIYGKWTECMWSVDPQSYEAHKKSERKGDNKKHKNVRTSLKTCDTCSFFNLKRLLVFLCNIEFDWSTADRDKSCDIGGNSV